MKIGGQTPGTNLVIVAIPRGNGPDIIFKAQAIMSMEVFDKVCPAPKPRTKTLPGGGKSENRNDPEFKKAQSQYAEMRMAWMVLESLKATPGLEWETIDPDQPHTWVNYKKELKEAGFSDYELLRITQGMIDANCLNEDLINEARQRFLSPAPPEEASQSPLDEVTTS
jgi:hypothetical protein